MDTDGTLADLPAEPLRAGTESELLIQVIQDLSRARDLQAIVEIVRHAARALAGSDGATFVLRDGDRCHYVDEDAIGPLWKGRRFPMTACISGWCMDRGEAAVIEDIYVDSRIPVDAYRPTFVKSLLMVPIRSEDPIGAIGNYWARRYRPSPTQVRLLSALADSTAVAIANVHLYQDLERRVARRTRQLAMANEHLVAEVAARMKAVHERTNLLEQARRESRARDEILRVVSHDLRNPLTNIRLGAAMGIQRLDGDSPADVRRCLEVVQSSADQMGRLLDDLLDVASIDAGRLAVDCRSWRAEKLLGDALDAHAVAAAQRALVLEADWGALPNVHCDRDRIQQVLGNLLANAIGITPPGGRVTLRGRDAGECVRFEVADTGPGIAPDDVGKLFDNYWRAADVPYRGSGLGLAIAHGIVAAHGGRIWADREQSAGALLCFTLPKAPPAGTLSSAPGPN
jgi:signal transduction histidine kinase